MAPVLLHGDIDVTVYEVHQPDALESVHLSVYLDNVKMEERHINNPRNNPKLEESFHIRCAHMTSNIIFRLERHSRSKTAIGQAYVPVNDIVHGAPFHKRVGMVEDKAQKPIAGGPTICLKLQFSDAKRHPNWAQGIKDPGFSGVPRTFFSQQKGCKVTLYQDAHVPNDFAPEILLDQDKTYEAQRCWEDMFDAISEAKHFIYIAGWSLYTEISLIRDPKRPKPEGQVTLGELLKKKAKEDRVRVVLLLWKDGVPIPFIGKFLSNFMGIMGTHDKKTQAYFKDENGIYCLLRTRDSDKFSHHQKIVVVDANKLPNFGEESDQRRIVSFIGGIDLCNGRYDTPTHSLFRTLDAEHSKDFHQPGIPGSTIKKGGPREPWHDVHCKLEGPVAWDVYDNFVQRFQKQGIEGVLLSEEELTKFNIKRSESQVMDPNDHDTWNVQLFRSIDDTATLGFPETAEKAFEAGLVSGKNKMIDRGIQDAYIQAIRRAKNFIYIESQYFIGSEFDWSLDVNDTVNGALNLIPNELSYKIVSKIQNNERFVVYVVIPMWPEGQLDETFGDVQNMLYFQRRTIEMMYRRIVQALEGKEKEKGNAADNKKIKEQARKYLSFFCLGNREVNKGGEYVPPQTPEKYSHYQKAQEARRFMIYVHSKMMIVDDEYIIVGSANINERSMNGGRDTEIAMGAYQPHHLASSSKDGARGQIHGFRMSLWYEHLGMLEDTFLYPEREECINRVNGLAQDTWNLYSAEWSAKSSDDSAKPNDLPRHLLRYPFDISDGGTLTNLSGFQFFPDTTAPILGKYKATVMSRVIPRMAFEKA